MARDGYKILDSNMHVFEPYDLYEKYMDAKWVNAYPGASRAPSMGK